MPELDDVSRRNLGLGVDAYFADLAPLPTPDAGGLREEIMALMTHHGSQKAAAAAIGVNVSTIRRWGHGSKPIRGTLGKIDRAYLRIHLEMAGYRATTDVGRRLAAAWSRGEGVDRLGAVLEDILLKNGVPASVHFPAPVQFVGDIHQMYGPGCEVSPPDNRENWPFNLYKYSA